MTSICSQLINNIHRLCTINYKNPSSTSDLVIQKLNILVSKIVDDTLQQQQQLVEMIDNQIEQKTEHNVVDDVIEHTHKELHRTHFNKIYTYAKQEFTKYDLREFKTKKGNTQNAERTYIQVMRNVLDKMGYTYKEAGSQQSKDFRIDIIDDKAYKSTLFIEMKKTDSTSIYFNDTCPDDKIYYIIIQTGTNYKTKKNIEPCIFGVNGIEFIEKDKKWITIYAYEINKLKQKFNNGEIMCVYPRPTYKAKIKFLYDKYYETAKILHDTY